MEQCEFHRELLNLPRYMFAVILVIGVSTQQRERSKPERCDLKYIVHENIYQHMDAGKSEEMLAPRAGQRPYKG